MRVRLDEEAQSGHKMAPGSANFTLDFVSDFTTRAHNENELITLRERSTHTNICQDFIKNMLFVWRRACGIVTRIILTTLN